jgi:RHS repeat-associated protein
LRYVFQDHQGSTRTVLDAQGQVKARRDYAPFGEDVGAVGTRAGMAGYNSTDETRQQYAGTERDRETGLDHTPWRKYDSAAGRWTSPDPYNGSMSLGDPQSFNRYAYVNNDPVNHTDPSGLNAVSPGTRFGGCPNASVVCGGGEFGGFGTNGSFDLAESFNYNADMPANMMDALARYESIRTNGYDPALQRYRGDVALQILDRNGNVVWQGGWMHQPTLGAVWQAATNIAEGMARNRVREELSSLGLQGHITLTPNGAGFNFRVNAGSENYVSGLLTSSFLFSSSSNPFNYLFHYKDAGCASGNCVDYRSLPGVVAGGSVQFVYNSGELRGYVDRDRFNPHGGGARGFLGHAFLEVIPNAISDVPNIPGVGFRGFPPR